MQGTDGIILAFIEYIGGSNNLKKRNQFFKNHKLSKFTEE